MSEIDLKSFGGDRKTAHLRENETPIARFEVLAIQGANGITYRVFKHDDETAISVVCSLRESLTLGEMHNLNYKGMVDK